MAYVPVIDISQRNSADRKVIVAEIGNALENIGFLVITGHGIPSEQLQNVDRFAREFFRLPPATKTALAKRFFNSENKNAYKGYFPVQSGPENSSLKEGFDIGLGSNAELAVEKGKLGLFWEQNVWPSEKDLPGFTACMQSFLDALQGLGNTLLGLIAESLGLNQEFFAKFFQPSLSTLRLLRYPENPKFQSGKLSCSEHTDSGALTLLLQDNVGGLQVQDRRTGTWHDVPPMENSFVINTGDLFERWTGGKFKATRHRVLGTSAERYSIPFFFEPAGEAFITPIPGCQKNKEESDNDGVVYAEYLFEKIKKFDEFKQA